MIFEESTKSCIDSTSFHEKSFFWKSTDGVKISIEKKKAEGGGVQGGFEKTIFLQIRGIYAIFVYSKSKYTLKSVSMSVPPLTR